jgi:hypothetical protein
MKINPKTLLHLLSFCCAASFAQTTGSISGKLEFPSSPETVLIQLFSGNNTLVKTQLNEPDGTFVFSDLPEGNYTIGIEELNFKPYASGVIEISAANPQASLPPIVLVQMDTQTLSEVIVQKKKPMVENKIDRTVVNVESMLTAAGGDALEVLEKSPGIIVDQNGTITFKGKSGVAVYIDDKPTHLSGSELEAYLKSLPASTLNQIELMTNPPAKYDAAGGSVINIVTKKSKARGFNGSINSRVSQGKRFNTREGVTMNYLNNKFRIFGNVGFAHNNNINDLYIYRRFKNPDGSTLRYFDQNSDLSNKANTVYGNFGTDYYASEKTTFGINVNGMSRANSSVSEVESALSNPDRVIDSTIVADNTAKTKFRNFGVNLNFRHDLEKGKITADADYLNYDNKINQRFRNFVYQPDNSISGQDEQLGYLPSDIDIFSFKTDYSRPIKNDGTIEAGYKISVSKTDNIADYRDVSGGVQTPNYDMTNHFKYDEIINAGYVNFNTSYRRFTFQAGLRVENTDSKGHQLGNPEKQEERFKRNYTNLFPTAYIQFKLDSIGDNSLVTSYGKRITRPYYEDLNPFVSPLDKFTFYAGNPYLSPTFTQNFEFSYRYKQYFSASLNYGYSKDDINETIEIEEGIYYSRPGNIGRSQVYSVSANAMIPFAKWLTTNLYSDVTRGEYQSRLYDQTLDSAGTWWTINVNNQFKFGKSWSGELSGRYQTDIVSTQFVLGARGQINVGVQKKVLSGNGSIRLTANDVFYGNIGTGVINNLQNTDATWINKGDTRFVALGFNYSFGKAFQPKDTHNASGADDEKNRVKG